MALVKWDNKDLYDPWASLRSLQDEINDLFNLDRFPSTTGLFDRRSSSPAIDVIEGANDLTVTCELPGMDQNDIDVSIASNVLTIKGTKRDDREEKKEKFYRKESWSGSFQRTLPLPGTVDIDKINADFKDGILTVKLPKKEEAKPKQITVKIK
jgi:HSP20 family protein